MPHTILGFSAPRRARSGCRRAPHALARPALFCLLLTGLFLTAAPTAQAQVTLLVPSAPSVEAPPERAAKVEARPETAKNAPKAEAKPDARAREDKKNKEQKPDGPAEALPAAAGAAAPAAANATLPASAEAPAAAPAAEASQPDIDAEVDVLITMLRPFQYEGLVMDMPQLFAVLRYDNATPLKEGHLQPERRDLLGDVEEIRYLDQKAWGANVALNKPGLYQFIIEARPWWDAARQRFVQHYVKTILPVYGVERGWDAPVGQRFEIVPRTRPFGLMAPVLFSGQARLEGKPLPNALVRMRRINMEKTAVPTPWHEELVARADSQGAFSFVLGQPGWWCCQAETEGAPLKGPDGQPRPLDMGALLWLFVDAPPAAPRQR
jgi:hypothetical protein